MTKRSGPPRVPGSAGAGSGVAANVRFAEYSSSAAEGLAWGGFGRLLLRKVSSPLIHTENCASSDLYITVRGIPDPDMTFMGDTMELLAGTSGFSYKEWLGRFYPDKLPADEMLRYYAGHFGTVEINNTFYRM